jgi:hypothetical protein
MQRVAMEYFRVRVQAQNAIMLNQHQQLVVGK